MTYDVIIIGSGPAGLTAAIYAARANFKTLVLAGESWGGGLMLTPEVENFPGFPEGIQGQDLMMKIRKQAEGYKVEIIEANFQKADFHPPAHSGLRLRGRSDLRFRDHSDSRNSRRSKTGEPFVVSAGNKTYRAKSIIIATGATHSPLDVPGEEEFIGRGVSYCATCDAAFFRNKDVAVVGGGNSALTEAIFIAKFAKKVIVIHRRENLKASQAVQQKARTTKNIEFVLNAKVLEILGDTKVTGLKIQNLNSGEIKEIKVNGVFAAVGYRPVSELFPEIEKDEKGYILAKENTRTNVDGVFVAGDVSNNLHKQAIVASGLGAMAALDAEKWLQEQK